MRVAALLRKLATLYALLGVATVAVAAERAGRRPNVLIIITDDQGYGDVGIHGNPVVRTPHIDRLAAEGVRLTSFYVSPVCSPTRASLLTGRYNYRTGVVDTYLGRSMMHDDEVTLAEMLAAGGYRTGIFGKWHLGDNHPMRPIDQGFDESVVLKGGGLGQPSDLPDGGSYVDPILLHNGRPVRTKGYVSDVIADATVNFIAANRDRPFFAYLAFNAPHDPLTEVPQEHYERYRAEDLSAARFQSPGRPLPRAIDVDKVARVYAMVSNIDDNVGRVMAKLRELGLDRDTIVAFITDNGPQRARFNAGMRGLKGGVHDGGIRVPCFVRWPAGLVSMAGKTVDRIAAHVDITPTILDACGVMPPATVKMDGVSLLPLLKSAAAAGDWPDRTLYFQWHRGDRPEAERAFAARSQRWKLVQAAGADGGPVTPRFELFDMAADPYETRDLSGQHPDIVRQLRDGYRRWFMDVAATRGFAPPRISIGTPSENPVVLTRQDWRGPRAGWGPKSLGHWDVEVQTPGTYEVTIHFSADAGDITLEIGDTTVKQPVPPGKKSVTISPLTLKAGPATLQATVATNDGDVGARYVEVTGPK